MPFIIVQIPIRAKVDFKTVQMFDLDDGQGRKVQFWLHLRGQNSYLLDLMISKILNFFILDSFKGPKFEFCQITL